MDVWRTLLDGALYSAAVSALLVTIIKLNPRWVLQDYPADVQALVPPKTAEERRMGTILGVVFMTVLIGGPLVSTWGLSVRVDALPFWQLFLNAFGVAFVFNLVDLLLIDWLMFCVITPSFIIVPGTEGAAGYKDYMYHLRAFGTGSVLSVVFGLVLAGIVWLL